MEWIANMEGPLFLALYAVVILTTLAIAYVVIRTGSSEDKVDAMVPVLPNPYEMAYMRGGEQEIGKLLLIDLAKRGYIRESSGKGQVRKADEHPATHELSAPQRKVFELVDKQDKPVSKLMKSREFQAVIEEIKSGFLPRLQREGLLVGDFKRAKVLFVSALLITGLGGYKLAVSLAKGKFSVGFLILFAIVAMIALWAVASPRLTWRGQKYFRNTQEAFRFATSDVVLDSNPAASSDMLLHVGLFGAPILFGTASASYATMLGLDPNRRYGSSGCSSGCGGADSGDGGDGGGGCGGCGGE